jgi:hypothetical protein
MIAVRVASVAMLASCLGGCLTPTEVANPDAITLRTAVNQVVDTLHEAHDRYKNDPKLGLYPSEATVTFNISSQSTETSGLQVGATVPATISPIPITASASDQIVGAGARGNQIAITFKNVIDLSQPKATTGQNQPNQPNQPGKGQPVHVGTNPQPATPPVSPIDWTKCFGPKPYPDYCNGVMAVLKTQNLSIDDLTSTQKGQFMHEIQKVQ